MGTAGSKGEGTLAAERPQTGLPPSLAIENAGSGEEGKALLEEALSDEDEVVRAVARARLEPDGRGTRSDRRRG